MFGKKTKKAKPHTPKDTLIIIGNGFDRWQGLPTGYDYFQKYYLAHRDEIMKKLNISKRIVEDGYGRSTVISDVELIYGNPLEPGQLDYEFWSTFEASLDKIDTEQLSVFFGKERKALREMEKSISNAGRILREAFCEWIHSIAIDDKDAGYRFGDNCLFINFNYTDTLQRRFRVKEEQVYHIHGEAADRESIIFGHSTHPQLPEELLYRFGKRFRGLYFVDRILYETDKHVQDNIQTLCMFLAQHAAMAEEIKNIYVLGHSMGMPDMEYFSFLVNATRVHNHEKSDFNTCHDEKIKGTDSMEEVCSRIQYTINQTGYGTDIENIDEEQRKAAARRYYREQEARNQEFQNIFFKSLGYAPDTDETQPSIQITPRTEDAHWHISYHSDQDKQWIETLMDELSCRNLSFYSTIEECLAPFKKD